MWLNICWRELILCVYLVDTAGNLDITGLSVNLSELVHEGVVPDTKFFINDGILLTSFHMNSWMRYNLVTCSRGIFHSREKALEVKLELWYVISRAKLSIRVTNETKSKLKVVLEGFTTWLILDWMCLIDIRSQQKQCSRKVLSTNDQLSTGVEVQGPGLTTVINVDVVTRVSRLSRLSRQSLT